MPWTPSDASQHTGLANTASRKSLWAKVANEILDTTGDEGKAIRLANSAVHRDVDRRVNAKVRRSHERREALTRFI